MPARGPVPYGIGPGSLPFFGLLRPQVEILPTTGCVPPSVAPGSHQCKSKLRNRNYPIQGSIQSSVQERACHHYSGAHCQGWALLHSLRSVPVSEPNSQRGSETPNIPGQLFLCRKPNRAVYAGGKCSPPPTCPQTGAGSERNSQPQKKERAKREFLHCTKTAEKGDVAAIVE